MKSLDLLGLVFDTGLSVTPLMGHLGCLASHWSVPVLQGMYKHRCMNFNSSSSMGAWIGEDKIEGNAWACMYSLPLFPSLLLEEKGRGGDQRKAINAGPWGNANAIQKYKKIIFSKKKKRNSAESNKLE